MNIVVIGGGTGSTVVLEGLKKHKDLNISVIVGMMDDGGSNATVRDEFGLLPLSDVRKSVLALSEENENEILRKLFTYRFSNGENMKGHTLGNLLMIAMVDIVGSEVEAINMMESLFSVRGNVIPVTLDDVRLVAKYDDGTKIVGEHLIDELPEDKLIVDFALDGKASIFKEAEKVIQDAEYIVMGPGDLFTTLLPNLLVSGMSEALKKSSAKIIYISNLMTKNGQTRHRTHSQIVKMIEGYIGRPLDSILINSGRIPTEAYQRYIVDGESLIIDDFDKNDPHEIVRTDLVANDLVKLEKGDTLKRSLVRHHPEKVANVLYPIFNKSILKRFFRNILSQYID